MTLTFGDSTSRTLPISIVNIIRGRYSLMGSAAGVADSITVRLSDDGVNGFSAVKIKCAIYNADGTLLTNGQTEEKSVSRTVGQVANETFNFTGTQPNLAENTYYYLAAWSESNSFQEVDVLLEENGSNTVKYKSSTYGATFPTISSWTNSDTSAEMTIYCSYQLAATAWTTTQAEKLGLLDTATAFKKLYFTGAEIVGALDTSGTVTVKNIVDAELVGMTDDKTKDMSKNMVESIGLLDDNITFTGAPTIINESLGITDISSPERPLYAYISDSIGFIDAQLIMRNNCYQLFRDESLGLSDSWVLGVDPWFNYSWLYRKAINLATLTAGYQLRLYVGRSTGYGNVNCNGHCLATFADLRFTKGDQVTELDYWIESVVSTSGQETCYVWVETDGVTPIYMYYGNSSAGTTSNGVNTFQFFDDFLGSTLDLAKWTVPFGTSPTVGSSVCNINLDSIKSISTFAANTAFRARGIANGTDSLKQEFGYGDYTPTATYDPMNKPHSVMLYPNGPARTTYLGNNNVSQTQTSSGFNPTTTQTIYDIKRKSTAETQFYHDGVQYSGSPCATNVPSASMNIQLYNYSTYTNIISWDWVLVRMFPSAGETTVSSYGSETQPATAWTTSLAEKIGLKDIATPVLLSGFAKIASVAEVLGMKDIASDVTKFQQTFSELLGLKDISSTTWKAAKIYNELLGLKDTVIEETKFIRTFAELLGLLDSKQTVERNTTSISELLGLIDGDTWIQSSQTTAAEKIGLLDVKTTNAKFIRTSTELLGLIDIAADVERYIRTFNELIGMVDSQQTKLTAAKTVNELLGLKETIALPVVRSRTFAESLGLLDAISTKAVRARTINELLGILDSFTEIARRNKTYSELLGLLDIGSAAYASQGKSTTANELLGLKDLSITERRFIRTYVELVGVKDVTTTNIKFQRTMVELLSLLDAFQKIQTFISTVVETALLEDIAISIPNHLFTAVIPETIGLLDIKTTVGQRKRISIELLGMKDTSLTNTKFIRTSIELVGMADTMQTIERIAKTITELLGLKDISTADTSFGKSTTINELLGLLDVKTTNTKFIRSTSELLGLKDISTTATKWIRASSELLGLLDGQTLLQAGAIETSESLGLLDVKTTKTVFSKTVNELLGLKDISATSAVYSKTFSELLGLLDVALPETVMGKQITVFEYLGLKDVFSETGVFHVTISELLGLLENDIEKPSKVISEIIGIKETATTNTVFSRSFTELLGLKDGVETPGTKSTSAAELLGIKDGLLTNTRFSSTATEKLGLLDSTITVTRFSRLFNETLGLTDVTGISRWFVDAEKIGLIESASTIMNWVYNNIGYLYETDVYY